MLAVPFQLDSVRHRPADVQKPNFGNGFFFASVTPVFFFFTKSNAKVVNKFFFLWFTSLCYCYCFGFPVLLAVRVKSSFMLTLIAGVI